MKGVESISALHKIVALLALIKIAEA